jgi:ATP-dependent Clp protease ATP-binding subunit ClpC
MSGKMDWFTDQAQKGMIYAHEEAERLQHSYIGTEHLLLGLMREKSGLACRILRQFDLEHDQVSDLIEKMSPPPTTREQAPIELNPWVKVVFALAVEEARNLKHSYIGTEHLLLDLTRTTDGAAFEVLKRMSVNTENVRQRVMRAFVSSQPPQSTIFSRAFQGESAHRQEETKTLDEVRRTVQLSLYSKILLRLLSDVAQTLDKDEKVRMRDVIEKLFATVMAEEEITMLRDAERLRLLHPLIRPFILPPD